MKKTLNRLVLNSLLSSVMLVNLSHAENESTVGNIELWPADVHKQIATDEQRIESILKQLSLKEKVAQLVMPEIRHVSPEDVKRNRFGSILNGGGAFPKNKKQASLAEWLELAQAYHDASIDGSKHKHPVPVIWGTDAVHGHNNVYRATVFPHNIGLGATRNEALLERIGEVTAAEVAATGIFWTFAPTITVPQNARWGRTYEGYSQDEVLVSKLGAAMVRGLQGTFPEGRLAGDKVLSTAKHFIGDGGTYQGIDQGNTRVSESELKNKHGTSYVYALNEGVQSVMASFNSWNGEKLHGQHYLLTQVLKNRMGFDGLVVGDWNGHGQLPGCTNGDCAAAVNAGVDIIMVPENWNEYYQNTLKQARKGVISAERLDDAVRRILRVKLRAGLFDGVDPSARARAGDSTILSNDEHKAVARQAVKESLVLLKNNDKTLPLKASGNILVVGKDAVEVEKQLGGWSLSWQGTGNTNKDFPEAESIYTGIEKTVTNQGGKVSFSRLSEVPKHLTQSYDGAIVVFGEPPYAEGLGDRKNLVFKSNKAHLKAMKALKNQGIPVVAIFITGRPLWMNPEINAADAFVAAWLPGSEAGAMSEVLFCETKYNDSSDCDFKGKLPFSWPGDVSNASRYGSKALFPLYYGLTYDDTNNLAILSETIEEQTTEDITLIKGWAQTPYKLMLQSGQEIVPVDKPSVSVNNKALTTKIIDNKIQEDAQRLTFNGKATAAWMLQNTESENWLNRGENAVLTLETRVLKQDKKQPLYLSSLCGAGCSATVDLSDSFRNQKKKQWVTHSVELSCLERMGLNLEEIQMPTVLTTKGKWKFELGSIGLASKPVGEKVKCPTK